LLTAVRQSRFRSHALPSQIGNPNPESALEIEAVFFGLLDPSRSLRITFLDVEFFVMSRATFGYAGVTICFGVSDMISLFCWRDAYGASALG
jgi:hypothetical protein